MAHRIPMRAFMQALFADTTLAAQAAEIAQALLAARSLRLTDIAAKMRGSFHAPYKRIQPFLRRVDPRPALARLLSAQAPFVLGDGTEVERPQARRTAYVGVLRDGRTRGFWLLLLAIPYRGRAIPCGFLCSSSRTIAAADSRNTNHWRAFEPLKGVLGGRPLVLDREFSYLGLLEYLTAAGLSFVIRLHLGSHPPKFRDGEGREVVPSVGRGQKVVYREVWYKGQVRVHLIGLWKPEWAEPLWVMSNLEPEEALRIYLQRMKIAEAFRDLKGLLGLGRQMNKSREYMEKVVALLLLVYTIGLLVGERLRDFL
jgi:hypothetical protein